MKTTIKHLAKPTFLPLMSDQTHAAADDVSVRTDLLVDTEPGGPDARPAAPARLLLAENNVGNQQLAVWMLKRIGYRIDVVANGAEALEALSQVEYAAVLMDCQMPELDGYQATREIRSREGSDRHTPVIAMTACGDRKRCMEAGMDDYIAKPVDLQALELILKTWV